MNLDQLKSKWIVYEKKRIEEKKKRRYLHFDAKIFHVDEKILNDIFNPDFVFRRFFIHLSKIIK